MMDSYTLSHPHTHDRFLYSESWVISEYAINHMMGGNLSKYEYKKTTLICTLGIEYFQWNYWLLPKFYTGT